MFGIDENSPIPLDENCLVFPEKILDSYPTLAVDFGGQKLDVWGLARK